MAIIQVPTKGKSRYSFVSLEASFNGRLYTGITKVSYSDTLEPGMVEGASPQILGRTRGKYECEGSFSMYRDEFNDLMRDLGDGYGEKEFDIVSMYAEEGMDTTTDRLVACRIKKVGNENQKGSDPSEVECELTLLYILRNGICLVKNLKR